MYIDKTELGKLYDMFTTCAPIFTALGDANRPKLILDIADAGEGGANVSTLAAKSHLSRPAVSHHLKVLRDSGFVTTLKRGTQIFYRLNLVHNLDKIDTLVHGIQEVIERVKETQLKELNSSTQRAIDAIIFDMDGVLFDSESITRKMWKQAAQEYSVSDIETAVSDCTGRSIPDTCAYLVKKYGRSFPAMEFRKRCSELFHAYVDKNGLPLMYYAREILDYLKQHGYRLALASSTRKSVVEKELADAGLRGYFETVTCGDMVTHSKPDPEIYMEACRSLGVDPLKCLAIEDSPNGILSAYGAGLKPVMIPDQIQPDDEIKARLFILCSNLKELEKYL